MKIVHVINSLGGSGGAEHGLVREISRFGSEIGQRVVILFAKDQLSARLSESGIAVESLGLSSDRAGFNWPLAVKRLRSLVKAYRPDVLHSSLFSANIVAQLTGRLSGVPVLSTFTLSGDPALLRSLQPGAGSLKASLLRRLAAKAARGDHVWFRALTEDAMVTNSELLGVDPERVSVIPRGVPHDLVPDHPLSREQLNLPEGVPVILNVGRQTAQKGHQHLLASFRMVIDKTPAHLVIVGREGETSAALRAAIRDLELLDYTSIVGYTPHVGHYYVHAAAFAFSSLMEGLGTAVLEAMVARLPVVAFAIPPVVEATDGGALAHLISPGDERGMSEGILEAIEGGSVVKSRVDQAYEWARREFSIEVVARRLLQALERVAASG